MKTLQPTEELEKVSRRVIWFEDPQQALSDPIRFVTYAMTYGTHEDFEIIRKYLSDDDLREVLENAPPGIFTERSWAYWNVILGHYPTPPLPTRHLD